ncbi:hypothetical protein [Sorangium cellulosum]|uniref:hypothetical protein n=1 Tax=Sorangium cellulosum TaxID=56 RepID=UPI0013316878|nr:hypothetical protein [Sorangium cellulosum]
MIIGALVAVPGCGDDDDGGGGSGGTGTTTSGTGGNGGNGGSADGGGGNGGDGGGGGEPAASCETYCAAVMANCTDVQAQYGSEASCVAFCEDLPEGAAGEEAGNSLACRAYHAGEAAADPTTHCIHAGPGGGGVCGAPADAFCTVAPEACPDVYADSDACNTEAAGFDATPPYAGPNSTGDTLACRLYHLTEATIDPETHCGHIGEASPVCM